MKSSNYSASTANPLDSAAKLRLLLEKRQSTAQTMRDGSSSTGHHDTPDPLSMDDLATLLNDSYNLTNHLEEQVQFYQNTVKMLRERSEQVVTENELLYGKLKDGLVSDAISDGNKIQHPPSDLNQGSKPWEKEYLEEERMKMSGHYSKETAVETKTSRRNIDKLVAGVTFQDRRYFYELEQEMDKVKKLNQEKTRRLESILQATREELQECRDQASKLQSRLRAHETEGELSRTGNVCVQCRKKDGIFNLRPSEAHTKTIAQLTRERDELMETLVKQKSLLTQCQQREFDAYTEVKKSVETVEQAQLEKAEALIKIQQLRCSMEEERLRQENVLAKNKEKSKQELNEMQESYERKWAELDAKLQGQIQKSDTTENQLDKLSREKVNLITDVEKAKAELMASKLEVAQISQDAKDEVVKITRQCVKAQQDLENFKNIQSRQLREHEQEKTSLMTENEELRRRLSEAQGGWVDSREECIRTLDKYKKLESDYHLALTSNTNLEKARKESTQFFKTQEEGREKHFLETLEAKEKEHISLRKELEAMLETQMQISNKVKEESKKMARKLEEKAQKYRLEKQKWREDHTQLSIKVETQLKQHEELSRKIRDDSAANKKLAKKVDFLKNENKKAMKTIYELLQKQNGLMQDRQNLSREVEYLRSVVGARKESGVHENQELSHEISQGERHSDDDDGSSSLDVNSFNEEQNKTDVPSDRSL